MTRAIAPVTLLLSLVCVAVATATTLQPPAHLPVPAPGKPSLPTPHPTYRPTYSLSCTLGFSAVARAHTWTVRNQGRTTVPAGLHFRTQIGSLHGNFTMPRALAPDDTEVFGTPVTALDPVVLTSDQCMVAYTP